MQAAAVTRGPFAITHKAGRSMVDSSTRSGIKEAGLPGQGTVTPAIFCRSRRLAETLVSISCTSVLGKMISVQLSTTVSAAAIHTSSCTAVVDEHHTGHQLQALHKAGKLQHRLKLVEIDYADNECIPPLKRKASYVRAAAASGLDSLEFSSRLDLDFPMLFSLLRYAHILAQDIQCCRFELECRRLQAVL